MWGDIPSWLTVVAIAVAVVQLRLELDRNRKSLATQLTSWIVSNPAKNSEVEQRFQEMIANAGDNADKKKLAYEFRKTNSVYGIVISNAAEATFHEVTIDTRMGKTGSSPIFKSHTSTVLPPGTWFIKKRNDSFEWDFATSVTSYPGVLEPIMKSDEYHVLGMTFTDNYGQQWETDKYAVLKPLKRLKR